MHEKLPRNGRIDAFSAWSQDLSSEAKMRENLQRHIFQLWVQFMPRIDGLTSRQQWMLYPIYAATVLFCLGTVFFFISLNDTRDFIGEKGVEYSWMYGSFERYLFINLASIGVSIGSLLGLYWLAQRKYLFSYLILWAAWLLGEPLLSLFYC